jgi:hypothetical protein
MRFVWEDTVGRTMAHQPHGFPEHVLQASACFSRVMELFLCSGELNTPAFFSIEFE